MFVIKIFNLAVSWICNRIIPTVQQATNTWPNICFNSFSK